MRQIFQFSFLFKKLFLGNPVHCCCGGGGHIGGGGGGCSGVAVVMVVGGGRGRVGAKLPDTEVKEMKKRKTEGEAGRG